MAGHRVGLDWIGLGHKSYCEESSNRSPNYFQLAGLDLTGLGHKSYCGVRVRIAARLFPSTSSPSSSSASPSNSSSASSSNSSSNSSSDNSPIISSCCARLGNRNRNGNYGDLCCAGLVGVGNKNGPGREVALIRVVDLVGFDLGEENRFGNQNGPGM